MNRETTDKNTNTQLRLKTGQQTNYKDNVTRCFTIALIDLICLTMFLDGLLSF